MVVVFNTYNPCVFSHPYKKKIQKCNFQTTSFKGVAQIKPAVKFFKKIFNKKNQFIPLKTLDGNQIQAELEKPMRFNWYLTHEHKCLGTIWLSRCSATMKGDSLPDCYQDKEYLFINSLDSSKEYKGIGTQLVKAVVEESQRLGLEGRVCLNTTTTKPRLGSPVPFYHKLGFKSVNSEVEKTIEDCIAKNQPLPNNCTATTMYLPKEKIIELLAKDK